MGSITVAAGKIPVTRRGATAATGESVAVRWILIGVAVFFLALNENLDKCAYYAAF